MSASPKETTMDKAKEIASAAVRVGARYGNTPLNLDPHLLLMAQIIVEIKELRAELTAKEQRNG